MRVQLSDVERIKLFKHLEQKSFGQKWVSEITGVSARTVTDWKRGKHTIPAQHFDTIIKLSGIEKSLVEHNVLDDWWNNADAGKKGAATRMQRHGPLGTPEGRRRGG
jgi:predicted XRE-type DNA-binding protein